MSPATQARRNYCLQLGHVVAKNAWWMAQCPKHGLTQHLGALDGNCVECQRERLEAR